MRGGAFPQDLYRTFFTGLGGTQMPSSSGDFNDGLGGRRRRSTRSSPRKAPAAEIEAAKKAARRALIVPLYDEDLTLSPASSRETDETGADVEYLDRCVETRGDDWTLDALRDELLDLTCSRAVNLAPPVTERPRRGTAGDGLRLGQVRRRTSALGSCRPVIGPLLVTGLLGSLHCVGMCGGFVLALDRPGRVPWRRDRRARRRSRSGKALDVRAARRASPGSLGAASCARAWFARRAGRARRRRGRADGRWRASRSPACCRSCRSGGLFGPTSPYGRAVRARRERARARRAVR